MANSRDLIAGSFILIVGLLGLSSAESTGTSLPPTLALTPSTTDVGIFANKSYVVNCESSDKNTQVVWFSPNGSEVSTNKGRVHTEGKDNKRSLMFEFVTLADKGNWICKVVDQNVKQVLNMLVFESISFVETSKEQEAAEGKDGLIRCRVTGNPAPGVSWSKGGKQITFPSAKYRKSEKGLTVLNVTRADKGQYDCQAMQYNNYVTDISTYQITFKVLHKPIAVKPLHARAEQAFGYLGGVVNLTCQAEAEPAANFTWHRNGKPVAKSSGRISSDRHISVLKLDLKDRSSLGDYTCLAKNSIGVYERIITLEEAKRPEPPKEIILRGANSDALDVEVPTAPQPSGPSTLAPQPDNLPIIGYKFEYMPSPLEPSNEIEKNVFHGAPSNEVIDVPSHPPPEEISEDLWRKAFQMDFELDGSSYLLTGLLHDTPYVIRAMSRNAAGLSTPSPPLFCRTLKLEAIGVTGGASSKEISKVLLTAVIVTALATAILNLPTVNKNNKLTNFDKINTTDDEIKTNKTFFHTNHIDKINLVEFVKINNKYQRC